MRIEAFFTPEECEKAKKACDVNSICHCVDCDGISCTQCPLCGLTDKSRLKYIEGHTLTGFKVAQGLSIDTDAPRFIIGKDFVLALASVVNAHTCRNHEAWALVAEDTNKNTIILCEVEAEEKANHALQRLIRWMLNPTLGRTIEFRYGCDFYEEQVVKRSYSEFALGFVVDGVDSSPDAGCYYDKEGYCTKTGEPIPCKCEGDKSKCE